IRRTRRPPTSGVEVYGLYSGDLGPRASTGVLIRSHKIRQAVAIQIHKSDAAIKIVGTGAIVERRGRDGPLRTRCRVPACSVVEKHVHAATGGIHPVIEPIAIDVDELRCRLRWSSRRETFWRDENSSRRVPC